MKKDQTIKEQAIELRKKGLTYPEISKKLGGVPKTTLSTWLSRLMLKKEALMIIDTKKKSKFRENIVRATSKRKINREVYFELLREKNKKVSKLAQDQMVCKVALAMLYLGEGGKGGGAVYFGNSDKNIIQTFLALLRFTYPVDETKFRVTVQCRADQDIRSLEIYWKEITKIPSNQFYGTRIDPRTVGTPSKKKEYKGVCRIDYFSADVFNELSVIANLFLRALSSVG